MKEIWKNIDGFCGDYEISNTGIVKSNKLNKNKILKQSKDRYGYLIVRLSMNGVTYKRKVHRLVANAFIPNPNMLPQVNHKNGNKEDNCVENLEWCTAKENLEHALKLGLREYICKNTPHYGEKNGNAKITKEIAEEIRSTCTPGDKIYGIRALSRKYGIGVTTVRAIVNNKTWTHEEI